VQIDPDTGAILNSIREALPDMPSFNGGEPRPIIAAEGAIWVANTGYLAASQILKIDPVTGRLDKTLTLLPTPVQTVSFAAGQSSLWVLTNAGIVGATDADTLLRIDPGTNRIVARIHVGNTGHGVAADSEGVWVVKSDGSLLEIDTGSNTIARTIPVGNQASAVALSGGFVWVSDEVSGVVYRVNPKTEDVSTILLPGGADEIAADDAGVWVVERASGAVVPIDPSSGEVRQPVRVGVQPAGIAIGAGYVWVADPGEGSVYRIDPASPQDPSVFPVGKAPGPAWVSVDEHGVWTSLG
jgi:streptogramin lyase